MSHDSEGLHCQIQATRISTINKKDPSRHSGSSPHPVWGHAGKLPSNNNIEKMRRIVRNMSDLQSRKLFFNVIGRSFDNYLLFRPTPSLEDFFCYTFPCGQQA